MFADCINNIDQELIPLLMKNVIVTGGSSYFPGLFERLSNELQSVVDSSVKLNIWHSNDSWFLIKKLAAMNRNSGFVDTVITKKKYEEYGSIAIAEYFKL